MVPKELAYLVELEDQIKQQAAVIEQMREAREIVKMMTEEIPKTMGAVNLNAIMNDLLAVQNRLALQPCPEILNKVRADAVREAAAYCAGNGTEEKLYRNFADRIEKGEA